MGAAILPANSPLELAKSILRDTQALVSHLESLSHPVPSFKPDSSSPPPTPEYEALRVSLNEASLDLLRLVNGPASTFRTLLSTHYDLAAYQVALEFNLFELVPLDTHISVSELAAKAKIAEDRVGMVMRFLATQRVFRETEQDYFEHTAASALMAKQPMLKDAAMFMVDEMFQAASDTAKSLKQHPYTFDNVHSPFATRHGLSAYEFYDQNPALGARFARAMEGATQTDRQLTELRSEYPWEAIGNGTLVDCGGGSGHVSIAIAKEHPQLHVIVQDLSPIMLGQGEKSLDKTLKDRVTFMQHDFFKPQPVDAAVYLLRQITHNWNDEDSMRLFRSFIPALERCAPGTPLLINDTVLPRLGERSAYEEHGLRQLDIGMWVVLGAKQRSEAEFAALLKQADPRLKIAKIHGQGSMGLIEVHLVK